MYQKRKKIIASMLIFMLTITHLNVIYEVLATSLENQSTQIDGYENIEFDAYFLSEDTATHETTANISGENKVYARVKVEEEGYLKETKIAFKSIDGNEANFTVKMSEEDKNIQKVENNEITLNQITNGNEVIVALPIHFVETDQININQFLVENKATLTAIYMDGNGKENKIEKDITIKLGWTAEKEVVLEENIESYIPYDINNEKGIIIQTKMKANLKNNSLPVKETNIESDVPNINGILPKEVIVVANTTKATNGEENAESFSKENYKYNQETAKLSITVKNSNDEEGIISWNKNATDEYLVSYIFDETVLSSIGAEGIEVNLSTKATMEVYANITETKTAEVTSTSTLTNQIGEIVTFEVQSNKKQMSKAYMYANIEIPYQEIITANIGLAELTDSITISQNIDGFMQGEDFYSTTIENVNYVYNKTIKISKSQLEKILGTSGKVEVYTASTLLTTIDNQMQADEEGNYVVDLTEYNLSTITLKTTKPNAEGKLQIVFEKAIKPELTYSDVQINAFAQYQMSITGQAHNGETKFIEKTITKEITLTEPETKADLVFSNTNLSTIVTNQNVQIKAILRNDSEDCKLYRNPTINIVLPSYITNINIKSVELFFDDELKITGYNVIDNEDGTKIIAIAIEGKQTKYSIGAIEGGANVIVTADISVNQFTPNKQVEVVMNYTNNNAIVRTDSTEQKQTTTTINFVAPTGVVATNAISNYAEGQEQLIAISGEEKTGIIEINTAERTAKFDMTVMNNYNNTIDTITVLGRIPHEGNKNILASQDLGTTFTMPMQSEIAVTGIDSSKVKVYYSENGEATKDVTLESNGWTDSPSDLSKVKSYCIVIENHTMNTAETFSFSYTAQIPANLTHNQSAYETYAVYFNNNLNEGTIEDKVEATKIGITTGTGAVIEATMTSNIEENTEVLEGKIIKYKLTVQNTGTHTAENVKATVKLPKYMSYVIEDTSSTLGYIYSTESTPIIEFGNIEGGQSVTKEVWAKVSKLYVSDICQDESHYITSDSGAKKHSSEYTHENSEYTAKVKVAAEVSADNLAKPIQSTEAINTITKAYFITSVMGEGENGAYVKAGSNYIYHVSVKSTDRDSTRENTKVTIVIPEELKYEGIELEQYNEEQAKYEYITEQAKVEYNDSSKILTVNIGSVNGNHAKELYIKTTVQTLPQDVYEKQVEFKATVVADNVEQENIDTLQETVHKVGLKVTQTSNIPENTKIATNEDFKYIFTIENLSKIPVEDITLTDMLPEEVKYVNGNIIYSDGKTKTFSSKNEEGNPEVKIDLGANITARIEIKVVANLLEEERTIQNKAIVVQKEVGTIETNTLTHIISAFEGNTDIEVEQSPKRISGLVWIDADKDGIRDEDEQKISKVQVMLLNNATGTLILDEAGNTIIKTTDENGKYTFENISQGNYTVIFLYDTGKYSATSYRVEEAGSEKDSDGIDTKITMDGQARVAAITEAVNVAGENVYNIDLGIVENPKFDLAIDKTVTKIIVQNSAGTTEYNYNDSKLAKRELVGKYINETTLVIEYKIKVTNEGAVDGYVKKIADFIPTGLKFNAELNRDWYSTQNGVVLNSSLSNTKIAPGESKEVNLILTMDVSEDSLGVINNRAEIYEAYNELGLEDIDSIAANQASNEDDISSADILITVKTGETIMFIGLSISIIATIGIGAYFIKKKVLR